MAYEKEEHECDHTNLKERKVFNSNTGVKTVKTCKDCGKVIFNPES
jgi:hypothetical protein